MPMVVATLKEVVGELGTDSDEERDEEAEVLQERTGEAATLFSLIVRGGRGREGRE